MNNIVGPVLITLLIVIVIVFIVISLNQRNVIIYKHRPHRRYIRVRTHKPRIIGGCAGTRYGCCPDGVMAKVNRRGSNC